MSQEALHLPVMLHECLDGLAVTSAHWYIDGTFGAGGHTQAILQAGGSVLAVDRDPAARRFLEDISVPKGSALKFVRGNFRNLDGHAEATGIAPVAGVLLDLGVSSMQIDEAERGFAFRQEGPLDMRMGSEGESAADVVNHHSQEELAALIYKYGEERHSRRIARAIVQARDTAAITTTEQLASIIQRAYPPGRRRDHPARRTFQALRIFVNDELGALEDALKAAERVLAPGGRLVVMSYHSLEDRIVKHFIRASDTLEALTKRPLTAGEEEIEENPRARSAKLRIAKKLSDGVEESSAESEESECEEKEERRTKKDLLPFTFGLFPIDSLFPVDPLTNVLSLNFHSERKLPGASL